MVTAGTFGGALAQWAIVWLFARLLGVEAVGEYSLALAISGPVFVGVGMGLRNVYLTLSPPVGFASIFGLRLAGGLIGAVVLIFCLPLFEVSPPVACAVAALKLSDSLLDICYARIQMAGDLTTLGILMITNAGLTVPAVFGVLAISGRPQWSIGASAVISAATFVVAWRVSRKIPEKQENDPATMSVLLRTAVPVVLAQLAVNLLTYLPVWSAWLMAGKAGVGRFSAASYLLVAANLAGSSAGTVLLTRFRSVANDLGMATVRKSAWALSRRFLLVGLVAAVCVVMLGDLALSVIYGPDFRLGYGSWILLAGGAVFIVPTFILNSGMLVLQRYRPQTVIAFVAVGVSVMLGALGIVLRVGELLVPSAVALVGAFVRFAGAVLEIHPGVSVKVDSGVKVRSK